MRARASMFQIPGAGHCVCSSQRADHRWPRSTFTVVVDARPQSSQGGPACARSRRTSSIPSDMAIGQGWFRPEAVNATGC
jgi:hypothetical protein